MSPVSRARVTASRRLATVVATGALGLTVLSAVVPVGSAAAGTAAATAAASDGDGRFTIAVMPDTQQEVLNSGDTRFTNRAQWLEQNKASLDLRYITHVGDVVNWDTSDHAQYKAAGPGVAALDAGGVPWSFSIGNHDSQATGPGGSARPGGNASVDIRRTATFNAYFGVSHAKALGGTFEAGKIDNSYSTFTAEGTNWLVLNLELWPRTSAVQWAQGVVASHPHHNVVIVTHAMLVGDKTGTGAQDNGGYGANSPQFVIDHLVKPYANVRFVLSGHAGTWDRAEYVAPSGNPVTFLQTCYHSDTTNPVRLITIDTKANTYSSKVYAPSTNQTFTDGSASSRTGMAWVRP